jgi:hypothetical protein
MGASKLGQLLVEEGLLSEADRRTIRTSSGSGAGAFAKSLIALGLIDEDELAAFIADRTHFRVASKDLAKESDDHALGVVDTPLLLRLEVLPLKVEGTVLTVAMADPLDQDTIKQLEFFSGLRVRPVIATLSWIRTGLRRISPQWEPKASPFETFINTHAPSATRRIRGGVSAADLTIPATQSPTSALINPVKPSTPSPAATTPIAHDDEDFELEDDSTVGASNDGVRSASAAAASDSDSVSAASDDTDLAETDLSLEDMVEDTGKDGPEEQDPLDAPVSAADTPEPNSSEFDTNPLEDDLTATLSPAEPSDELTLEDLGDDEGQGISSEHAGETASHPAAMKTEGTPAAVHDDHKAEESMEDVMDDVMDELSGASGISPAATSEEPVSAEELQAMSSDSDLDLAEDDSGLLSPAPAGASREDAVVIHDTDLDEDFSSGADAADSQNSGADFGLEEPTDLEALAAPEGADASATSAIKDPLSVSSQNESRAAAATGELNRAMLRLSLAPSFAAAATRVVDACLLAGIPAGIIAVHKGPEHDQSLSWSGGQVALKPVAERLGKAISPPVRSRLVNAPGFVHLESGMRREDLAGLGDLGPSVNLYGTGTALPDGRQCLVIAALERGVLDSPGVLASLHALVTQMCRKL